MTAAKVTPALNSVKQWHLESLGTRSPSPDQTTEILHTRFSSWTPLENQSLNEQLFQERVRLISHWFDMWTDKQRKQFLHWILLKCSASQLKFVGKWFVENTPVIKVDFTSLLPRFISLYIFSFLSPKDLCAGAQVSWHWKFLTEQDCLWMPKCVRFGWFLPYSPAQNEYSSWKKHYIACATHLDGLAPKEATETYKAISGPQTENEEQKERMYEKWLQKVIRERLVLHKSCRISMKDLLNPEVREFWKKLGSCVTSQQEGGYVDIFLPLAASEAGKELLSQLSCLTGAFFRTPTGIATGSYQHICSEWLGNDRDSLPPSLYFTEAKLQMWLRLTELLEDTLNTVRKQLRPYLYDLQKKMTGKIIGQIVFDAMSWSEVQDNQAIAKALTDGLTELSRGNCENPLEFLSLFLLKNHSKNKELRSQVFLTEYNPEASVGASVKNEKLQGITQEKRETFARELLISEKTYVRVLEIIRDVYTKPLKAALTSNRPILSHANVQIIFSDIMDILQLNRWFLAVLTQRLKEWNPTQNLGDIFIKFGQQFQTYTNFYNNYAVILKTIDQCRETIPLFRAFLKRHDKTVITGMRSLQELLLCPSKRFEEYIVLLYALKLHTPTEHSDREDLTSAIKQMHRYKDYIDQLKKNVGRDDQLLTTQRLIQGCPHLLKANRYLIRTQNVAQLRCCSEKVCAPFRLYEHIYDLSLFLFNDILVISQRSISHKLFEWSSKMTHQFLAMVALHQLFVEDIPESKYIKNAFLLQGPRLQLICSTEEADKFPWLSALQRAIICNTEENGSIC